MAEQALLIIDMQQGLFSVPREGADELVARLNALAARCRAGGMPVIFIQQCGPEGDDLHPSRPGHALHPDLIVEPGDIRIPKTSCDAFIGTELAATLAALGARTVIVTGCATDYCVDSTVRGALGRGYPTIVPEDGHTTFDRPHISARQAIAHHNAVWADFLSPAGPARLSRCADLP